MISDQMRVAVLFWRLGPYHHARLNAAGKLMETIGLEACGAEEIYAWQKVEGAASFKRFTLTERELKSRTWRKELSRQIWRVLDQTKPDVVVVPGWSFTDALSALSWCAKTGTPAVVMSESTEWDEQRQGWKEWIKQRMLSKFSAALVGGTPHRDYLKTLGMPAAHIFFGYDAVDNEYFAKGAAENRERRTEIQNRLGLPEHYYLASARFIEKKNLSGLIEAYGRYRQIASRSNAKELWDLVLLGDGPLRESIQAQILSLDLAESVHLPGFKQYDDLPAYYGLASAFVHASTVEQWGLVVNEAMASGLPLLVSKRCGCATDLVKEGVNGFTFDPGNTGQLAELMCRISAPAIDRVSMGRASQEMILEWGPLRFASGLAQAVNVAIQDPRRPAKALDRGLLRALSMR